MSRRKSVRDSKGSQESHSLTTADSKPRKKRSSRSMRLVTIALLTAVGLVVAAPTLISATSIPNDLLSAQLPAEVGTVSTTSAQLGWMGPTSLSSVQLKDAAGEVLLEADQIYLDASLTDLLLGSSGTKRVAITRPIVNVQLSPAGSNWESFLDAYKGSKEQEDQQPEKGGSTSNEDLFDLTIEQAQIRVSDVVTKERWQVDLDNLNLNQVGRSLRTLLDQATYEGRGKITSFQPDGSVGPTVGEFYSTLNSNQAGARALSIKYQSVNASILGTLLRRADPSMLMNGMASGKGQIRWEATGKEDPSQNLLQSMVERRFQTAGNVTIRNAAIQSNLTGVAPVRLQAVNLPWQMAAQNSAIVIDRLSALSDIGQLGIQGTLSGQQLEAIASGNGLVPLGLRLDGDVDLVKLAQIAPEALRLQRGVQLKRGRVVLRVEGDPSGAPLLKGLLSTDDIAGVAQGRAFNWQKPLKANFTLARSSENWSLAALNANSTFFKADVQNESTPGNEDRLRTTAKFDLDQLARELGQFVDLGEWQLSGTGKATAVWQKPMGQTEWRLASTGNFENVNIGLAAKPIVAEEKLTFQSELFGVAGSSKPSHGELTLRSEDDILKAKLTPETNQAASRSLDLSLNGNLASWYRRAWLVAQDLPRPDQVQVAGSIAAKANGSLSGQGGQLDRWQLNVENLKFLSSSLSIEEPRIEASGDLAWNSMNQLIRSSASQLASSTIAFSAKGVELPMQSLTSARGEFFYRTDLSQLQSWFSTPNQPLNWRASGGVEGRALLEALDQGVRVTATANGKQCKIIDLTKAERTEIWSEQKVNANTQFELSSSTTPDGSSSLSLAIQELSLQSQTAKANARGQLGNLATLDSVDVSGSIDYDLQKVTALLFPQLGDSFHLKGQDRATFRLVSDPDLAANSQVPDTPLARLNAKIEAPWKSGDLFGLPIGPGKVGLVLDEGLVRFDPLEVAVAKGRLTAEPTVALAPPPTVVSLKKGPLVSNVGVSLEVADRILKFIAPVLADAARIEGNFSLGLNEFVMPVNALQQGRAQGVLTIHQARVLPGPGVAEWVDLAWQVRGIVRDGVEAVDPSQAELLTIQNQAVQFQMAGGRVYHKRLDFQVGDVTVISQGSVGIDESLNIVLSIPVLDEWIERRPILLAGFRGKSIQVPITGTLKQPKIDREVLRELARDLLRSAAEGAINSGIDALLKRLQSR